MDCTRCAQMLDDPDRALAEAASRGDGATVDPCCRETLDLLRLERGVRRIMPMHEPHPSLDAIILKAAAARVAGATPVLAVAPAIVDPAPARSFVARLRSWVTAPQVAMATITALAVVIGVFYVPSRRSPMQADGDTVMQVAPSAAPEATAAPAPFELGPPTQVAAAPKPDSNTQTENSAATTVALSDEGARADTDQMIAALAEPEVVEVQAPNDVMAFAREAPAAESLDRTAMPSPTPASPPVAMRSAAPRSTSATTTATPATAPTAPTAMTADGIVAASDALVRARVLRSRGQCAAAVPLYEQWLASPSSGSRGDAMLELAGCYEATGRHDRARALYERATAVPQVASRARAELESLEADTPPAAARATGRTASEARAGAAAPPPAAAVDSAAY